MKISRRAQTITPFYVMELLEQARQLEAQGHHIIHLEIGEPDFETPTQVKEEAVRAIKDNYTFYTHSLGIPELRERISEYYLNEEGVSVSPENIIITNGTSGAFLLLFATLLDRGDVLALSDPGYPCYRNFGVLVDADIAACPASEETHFEITVEQLRRLATPPKVLTLASPANPTGIVYKQDGLSALYSFLASHGGFLVVDEIYSGLTYGQKHNTALPIGDRIAVINGFSKAFAMTGWRLGWMIVPDKLVRPIQKIAQNVFISPPTVSQYAALSAFRAAKELETMKKTYKQRRDFLLPALKGLGFRIPIDPEGAFYIYAGIDQWGIDSMEFVGRALGEAGVALTPGYDFGSFKAGSYVRFSYANSIENIAEGCRRLGAWLPGLVTG